MADHVAVSTLRFPGVQLSTRDAHKLRGFVGNLFREYSPLLHNHDAEGQPQYHYPLIQYKVVEKEPLLLGLGEGAQLLPRIFLDLGKLELDNRCIPVEQKHIQHQHQPLGLSEELHEYQFRTLWMALNQANYQRYRQSAPNDQHQLLNRLLVGNILSAYKGLGVRLGKDERVMVKGRFQPKTTQFKNEKMLAFSGSFVSNALLPEGLGLGKSVARGFGSVFSAPPVP